MQLCKRRPPWKFQLVLIWIVAIATIYGTVSSGFATSKNLSEATEYEIKAVFLYNFLLFIKWPGAAAEEISEKKDTITIGILGEDPFGNAFSSVENKPVKSIWKKLVIKRLGRYSPDKDLTQCGMLFISASEIQLTPEILAGVKDAPIITVDDNEEFLDSTSDVLELEGYDVTTAASGPAALALVDKQAFDLVIMDIKMPGMNGVACFMEMKKRYPDISVVMATAYSVEGLIQQALAEGAIAVLDKPLQMDALLQTIKKETQSRNGGLILVAEDNKALCGNMID